MIYFGYLLCAASTVYGIIACMAACGPLRASTSARADQPRVTILKPLCGVEPETYECLRSFCEQDYAEFQVLFGIADPADPVVPLVERLRREFPKRDLQVAIDQRQHGSSRKVSNLINMMTKASHDYLVLADSDVRVAPDYLARVVAPLHDPQVGLVTCPYRGVYKHGRWSILGAMFINEWFIPSVRVAAKGGSRSFAFGATIALRREVLARMGGFHAIADHLADDYRLGELSRGMGLRTALSDVEVEIAVVENTFEELAAHEIRWLRTIRAVRPNSHLFCFVTFGLPVTLLGGVLAHGGDITAALFGATLIARLTLHLRRRQPGANSAGALLIPFRDCLSLVLWGWSLTTRRVKWRDQNLEICRDGSVLPVVRN
ncbi:MAG: bacteriohopanetetrol glucosamine biosynthesis glycosyltransferase HpnI [Gammaproteobacteria bacterium]